MTARRFVAASVFLAALASAVLLHGAEVDTEEAKLNEQLQSLLRQRLETASTVYKLAQLGFTGRTISVRDLTEAHDRYVEAELALAKTPADTIAILESKVTWLKEVEKRMSFLISLKQSSLYSLDDQIVCKRNRETAEIEVLKARLAALKAK